MARLPIDISTSGVRQNLPDAVFQPGSASPDAFGAGIGQSLQQLGNAGGELAQKVSQYAEKEQKFDALNRLTQTSDQLSIQQQEQERALSGNAAGHYQAVREQARKTMDDFLGTLPESQRSEFASKASAIVAARTQQAFAAQYQQSDANTKLVLGEEARKAGLQVNQQPGVYDAALASANELIDASPLTPLEKTKRKQELKNSLAYTASRAEAEQNPTSVIGQSDRANTAMEFFQKKGWTKVQAAGIVANLLAESNLNTGARNKGDGSDGSDSIGIGQWNGSRAAGLQAYAARTGRPWTDINVQLEYVDQELNTTHTSAASKLKAAATLEDATGAIVTDFEKPQGSERGAKLAHNWKGRLAYANQLASGESTGTTPASSARANLTADQARAVDEVAQTSLRRQQVAQTTADNAAQQAALNQTYIDLKEGANPQTTYEAARKSGVLSDYDNIVKAEKIIADRNKGDDDLTVGIGLMQSGRAGANPFDKAHKDGIDAYYNAAVKAGQDPAAAAAAVFDRTGLVPPTVASQLRKGLVSGDPAQMVSASQTAANMLTQNPNAMAGVEGKDQIEAAASEFGRLTGSLGLSPEEAGQRIAADARTPKDPVKDEVLQKFKKDYLTVDKLDTRMHSQLSNWIGRGADQPVGPQRSAIASVYNDLASEGFRQFQDPDKALAWADFQMKKQFGSQNGVITRYPPDKAGLPALEGKGTGWINEQAADTVKDQLGIVVDPSQVALVPVARDGANTAQAFTAGGVETKRADGTPLRSVPYQIVVTPTADQIKAGASVQVVNGAYFPDLQTYVDKKNAEIKTTAKDVLYDANGVPYQVPAHAPELLQTPEQVSRRKQAETNADLLKEQERRKAQLAEGPEAARRRMRTPGLAPGGFPAE